MVWNLCAVYLQPLLPKWLHLVCAKINTASSTSRLQHTVFWLAAFVLTVTPPDHCQTKVKLGQCLSKWSISTPSSQLEHPRSRWIVTRSNGGHSMVRGSMNNCWVYCWSNEASKPKLLLIRQGTETAFFNKSNNKIKLADQISARLLGYYSGLKVNSIRIVVYLFNQICS